MNGTRTLCVGPHRRCTESFTENYPLVTGMSRARESATPVRRWARAYGQTDADVADNSDVNVAVRIHVSRGCPMRTMSYMAPPRRYIGSFTVNYPPVTMTS